MTESRTRFPLLCGVVASAALSLAPLAGAAGGGDTDGGYTGIPPQRRTAGVSGLPGVDHVPPVVKAAIATKYLRTVLRTGKLKVTVRLNERGGVGMVGAIQALKMRPGARLPKSVFATSSGVEFYPGPGTHTFGLKLTSSSLKRLRGARSIRAAVVLVADDAVRNRAKSRLKRTLG